MLLDFLESLHYVGICVCTGKVGIVHIMGLQTHTGIWVWVRWVWVWVEFKVPTQNPYPYGGFGRYIPNWVSNYLLLLSHTNKATSTPSTMVILTSIDFFPSTPSCHHLHLTTSTGMLIHAPRRTNERTMNKRGGWWCLTFKSGEKVPHPRYAPHPHLGCSMGRTEGLITNTIPVTCHTIPIPTPHPEVQVKPTGNIYRP